MEFLHHRGNLIDSLGHLGQGRGLRLHGLHHNVHLRGHVAGVDTGLLQGVRPASEELSAEAASLKQLVDRFTLASD